MIVLLDCDGVLAHFTRTFLDYFKHPGADANITEWDIVRALPDLPKDAYALFGHGVQDSNLCAQIPPYAGARDFVAALQAKHDVYAVTTPFNEAWLSQRATWLAQHVGIPLRHQVQCADKAMVYGDVLIDDRASTCESWTDRWSKCSILFDRPWNRQAVFRPDVRRAYNYGDVLARLGCL